MSVKTESDQTREGSLPVLSSRIVVQLYNPRLGHQQGIHVGQSIDDTPLADAYLADRRVLVGICAEGLKIYGLHENLPFQSAIVGV